MAKESSKDLISNLSYEIVKDVAPDEIDLFEDIKEQYLKNPKAFSEKDPKKREKMLGFASPTGSEQFLTGIILPIVKELVWPWAKKKLETKLEKKETKLSKEEIKKMRDDAYNRAISLGMDEQKAELMADSLAGKLVLAL